MMKTVLIVAGCFLLILVGVFVFTILNLGPVIKTAVNTYGPGMLKTEVTVADVDVSVFSGRARLDDFWLGNPKGFTTPRAIQVKRILVNIQESSLIKDTIVIDRIVVDNPEITYEIKGKSDNFRTLMENLKTRATPEPAPEKKPGADNKGKKLLIRDFSLKGGRVNLAVSGLKGQRVTAVLPDIHLQNIGRAGEGATPETVFMQIIQAVYGAITSPDMTRAFVGQINEMGIEFDGRDLRKQIEAATGDLEDVKTEIKDLGKQIKGLFGK